MLWEPPVKNIDFTGLTPMNVISGIAIGSVVVAKVVIAVIKAVRIEKKANIYDGEISINLRDNVDDLLYTYESRCAPCYGFQNVV